MNKNEYIVYIVLMLEPYWCSVIKSEKEALEFKKGKERSKVEYTEKQKNLATLQISIKIQEKRGKKLTQVSLGLSILTIFPESIKLKKRNYHKQWNLVGRFTWW